MALTALLQKREDEVVGAFEQAITEEVIMSLLAKSTRRTHRL